MRHLSSLLVTAVLFASVFISARPALAASDPIFGSTVDLSHNFGDSLNPEVAVSGSYVYVAWWDETPGNFEILFERSVDGGLTFDPPINLSNNPADSFSPAIAASGSNVYVVWEDNVVPFGKSDIFYRRSTDYGFSFDNIVNISNNVGSSLSPHIASSSSNVYVVWEDNSPGPFEVFFARSVDLGFTFTSPTGLTGDVGNSGPRPQIAAASSNVYVAWSNSSAGNYDIFFTRSTSNGRFFDDPVNLSTNLGFSGQPQIAASGVHVYIAWSDNSLGGFASEIFFRSSDDDGLSFSHTYNLSGNPSHSTNPGLAASGSDVFVAWQDDQPGNYEIFFLPSYDYGLSFSGIINVSNSINRNGKNSGFPKVAISDNNVYVVWEGTSINSGGGPSDNDVFFRSNMFDRTKNVSYSGGQSTEQQIAVYGNAVYVVWTDDSTGNDEIMFRSSTDSGATFPGRVNLSSDSGGSFSSQIAAYRTNVYVVWVDTTSGNEEIFFRGSTNFGSSFGSTINLSGNSGNSAKPQIVAFGDNVYVVWQDVTPGNNEIFYRKSADKGGTFGPTLNLSNNPGGSTDPRVAVYGSNVYVVWEDATLGDEVFFAVSKDGGASFGSTVNLSNDAGDSSFPEMTAYGHDLYVVWIDNTNTPGGKFDVFFVRSVDGGASFDTVLNLSNNLGTSDGQKIALSGSNVFVAWSDDTPGNSEIFYTGSTDNGGSFGPVINMSNDDGSSSSPRIAAAFNDAYLVWDDNTPGNDEIFLRASRDGGTRWGGTVNLSRTGQVSLLPSLRMTGGLGSFASLYVAWQEQSQLGKSEVYFVASSVFGVPVPLDSDGDGITDEVDVKPLNFSPDFSDTALGGRTTGTIVDRGAQLLTITDEQAADLSSQGIRITADPSGGTKEATIKTCGISQFTLGPGASRLVLCEDTDGDGIFDNVDTMPTVFSNDFSDVSLGGTTTGTITARGGQMLTVVEKPNPLGVRIAANPSGGAAPATVSACSGMVMLTPGDAYILTCSPTLQVVRATIDPLILQVVNGAIDVTFIGSGNSAGITGTTSLTAGNILVFDSSTFTFIAPSTNTVSTMILVGGQVFTVAPGQTFTPPQIMISKFFTDPDLNPLQVDSQGNPKVDVVLAVGKVRSTNPGQVLAWVNITNTGVTPLQSLRLNETLPVDWRLNPSKSITGAVHIFFVFTNGTRVEITRQSQVTVTLGNPETVSLSIPGLNATAAATPLPPRGSILLSAKISYELVGTNQGARSYPRNYTDTASAVAWTAPSFTGTRASRSAGGFFLAYAKVLGDLNADFKVDILDAAIVAYSYGSKPGDAKWNPNADIDNNGVIEVLDAAQMAIYYGTSS